MSTIGYMMDVVTRLRTVLDAHETHMKLFDQHAVQVEGWLKGELLHFFDIEKADGRLRDYWPESPPESRTASSRERIDYELELATADATTKVWLELKHFQIGCQKGVCYKAHGYLARKSYGIYKDVVKLRQITAGDRYVLVLATKNPGRYDWSTGVATFNADFGHLSLHIHTHTDPSDFPSTYFVGLLEVPRGEPCLISRLDPLHGSLTT